MLRTLSLFTLLLSPISAVAADNPTEAARHEAQQFIGPCMFEPGQELQMCLANRAAFVWDYVSAKSGDIEDQLNVAYMLNHGGGAYGGGGIIQNDLEACAWYLLVVTSGSPRVDLGLKDLAGSVCRRVPESGGSLPVSRADRLIRDIYLHRARKLPGDSNDFYALALKGKLTEDTFPVGNQRPGRTRKGSGVK